MSNYYYLVSQLPFLQFGVSPFITEETFLYEAKKWMSQEDFYLLAQVNVNGFVFVQSDPPLLKEFKIFERGMRQEFSEWRKAVKEGKDYKISSMFSSLVLEGNPLDIEKRILRARWDFLDDMEAGHFFDREALISFFLKLQILKRLFIFDKEKGLNFFDSICEVKYE